MNNETLARALGWFSLGLGLYEVAAPKQLCETLGMDGQEQTIRLYGLREIVAGVGILSQKNSAGLAPWVWGRVGGDALDITTLLAAAKPENPKQVNAQIALGSVLGVTIADAECALNLTNKQLQAQ